jgi:hypothetical protein
VRDGSSRQKPSSLSRYEKIANDSNKTNNQIIYPMTIENELESPLREYMKKLKLFWVFALALLGMSNSYADNSALSVDEEWIVEGRYDDYYKNHIVCRRDWEARNAKNDMTKDLVKCKFAIHHSAGTAVSSTETVKNIQRAHMEINGWSDIGYHFLIGRDGQCFEGRELQWQGAHVDGDNKGNIGICFLGCFESSEPSPVEPTSRMIDEAGELIAVLAERFNIELSLSTIKGHRQHKKAQTLCPGNRVMERLNDILSKAIASKTIYSEEGDVLSALTCDCD